MDLELDRRRLLLGGLGVAATAAMPTVLVTPTADAQAIIHRKHLGYTGWGLRSITNPESPEFNGYGMHIPKSGPQYWRFRTDFYDRCTQWARAFRNMLVAATVPKLGMDYFLLKFTYRPYGANDDHPNSIAMDLAGIYFRNLDDGSQDFVDMNMSWRDAAPLTHRRRYVAVAAMLRAYFPEVLTAPYLGHYDHIHFDMPERQPRPS